MATLVTDDFLRTTAVLLLSGAFDQLTGWNPHNYYLYYDGKHERWRSLRYPPMRVSSRREPDGQRGSPCPRGRCLVPRIA